LNTIENFLSLLGRLQHLVGSRRLGERLIGVVELQQQQLILLLQRGELMPGVFVFTQRSDRLRHLLAIHLREELGFDDDRITIECGVSLLFEHKNEPGGVRADFVSGDVHAIHDRDAFEIGSHLFECVPFGGFGGETDGVFPGVAIAHPVFTGGGDHSDFGMGLGGGKHHVEEETQECGEKRCPVFGGGCL